MQKILHPTPFVSSSRMVSLLKTSWNISRQWQKYILTVSLHPLILEGLVVTLNFECQITFKDHFTFLKRQHCSPGMLGSSCAGQQMPFQYYFIVRGPLQWVLEFVGGRHLQPHHTVPSTKELGMLSKSLPWWNCEGSIGQNIIQQSK